jgi:prepilin-type N-terminal cleavage/methylation domain-containing protein
MRRQGFTLIELMIVIAIIAIIAAIAIPSMLEARKNANETAAIAGLKAIQTAEAIYRERYDDPVVNGSSYTNVHVSGGQGLYEVGLLEAFKPDTSGGAATANFLVKQGYRYFGRPSAINADRPYLWIASAWPVVMGSTGDRRFITNHTGTIWYHKDWNAATPYNYITTGYNYVTCDLDSTVLPPDGLNYLPVGK